MIITATNTNNGRQYEFPIPFGEDTPTEIVLKSYIAMWRKMCEIRRAFIRGHKSFPLIQLKISELGLDGFQAPPLFLQNQTLMNAIEILLNEQLPTPYGAPMLKQYFSMYTFTMEQVRERIKAGDEKLIEIIYPSRIGIFAYRPFYHSEWVTVDQQSVGYLAVEVPYTLTTIASASQAIADTPSCARPVLWVNPMIYVAFMRKNRCNIPMDAFQALVSAVVTMTTLNADAPIGTEGAVQLWDILTSACTMPADEFNELFAGAYQASEILMAER